MKILSILICLVPLFGLSQASVRRDTAVLIQNSQVGFKENCQIKVGGGCKCEVNQGLDDRQIVEYENIDLCKKSVELQTAENKKALNEEIKQKFGDFKENCFPKPSGGCKCNVDLGNGEEVKEFTADADCRKSVEASTVEHKKELNEEIKEKFGDFKENCFPKPSGGCKCNEKDANGNDVVTAYNNAAQCKLRSKRDVNIQQQRQQQQSSTNVARANVKSNARSRSGSVESNYDVRDPVRERAQANYAAVVDELKNKFKGLKEGCFPRPKGCLCVIGKTPEGRDITERRMKDSECKCKEGERGPECPAA